MRLRQPSIRYGIAASCRRAIAECVGVGVVVVVLGGSLVTQSLVYAQAPLAPAAPVQQAAPAESVAGSAKADVAKTKKARKKGKKANKANDKGGKSAGPAS